MFYNKCSCTNMHTFKEQNIDFMMGGENSGGEKSYCRFFIYGLILLKLTQNM